MSKLLKATLNLFITVIKQIPNFIKIGYYKLRIKLKK